MIWIIHRKCGGKWCLCLRGRRPPFKPPWFQAASSAARINVLLTCSEGDAEWLFIWGKINLEPLRLRKEDENITYIWWELIKPRKWIFYFGIQMFLGEVVIEGWVHCSTGAAASRRPVLDFYIYCTGMVCSRVVKRWGWKVSSSTSDAILLCRKTLHQSLPPNERVQVCQDLLLFFFHKWGEDRI